MNTKGNIYQIKKPNIKPKYESYLIKLNKNSKSYFLHDFQKVCKALGYTYNVKFHDQLRKEIKNKTQIFIMYYTDNNIYASNIKKTENKTKLEIDLSNCTNALERSYKIMDTIIRKVLCGLKDDKTYY